MSFVDEDLKRCSACDEVKPAGEFYAGTNRCKVCDNARRRKPSPARKARTRTYMAAQAELARRHPEEFREILTQLRHPRT